MRPYKGVDLLLDALSRLEAAGPPWRAIVAGEWYVDRASADARVARPPLAGRVHIVDRYVPDDEAAELFAACDVVVLPYRDATQSGVVPLAWAHGRPVVTTAVGGLPDAVEDGATGLLVAPGDPAALAEALERIRRGFPFDPVRTGRDSSPPWRASSRLDRDPWIARPARFSRKGKRVVGVDWPT